ncbi:PAS domain-containing protein [Noviherbaspirillum humi]|uniref:histidine kinase n=1 Tax=Noviherbaspirillum humi TaxID=1688639 RepID=A0A239DNX2_9BURK|nr:ATP-binding protein [Noviherbaspirillum humi]SNS34345.1 PAS domain-containing protein [Noviherbaspirillum humi]
MALSILLLDDNPDDRALSRRELERHFPGCAIREAGDRAAFEAQMAAGLAYDVIITDYQMRWTTGLDVLQRVKAHDAERPVIMFTATGTQEIAVEAMKLGLDDYVIKSPRHYARLPVAVRTCLDRAEIRARAIRSETRLSALLENIHLGVFRMSLDGRVEEANAALRTMLGRDLSPAEMAGHPLLAKVREKLPSLAKTLDAAEIQAQFESDPAGFRFYVVKLLRVRVNGHDAIDGIVEDATSLRRADAEIHRLNAELEQRILERTNQLEEANEALEAFGFSVSHDLREPLRTIQGYAHALRQDFGAGELDNLRNYIDRIDVIARRIDLMVSDLLEFARLSRAEIPTEIVRVAAAVGEAQAVLQAEPAYRQARIQVCMDPELSVKAHRLTLVQALTNLLSNACKFVRAGQSAAIVIQAVPEGRKVRIAVQDNGIGIDEAALGRIFNVFERLHGEEEYPGTGIGLAIVKKGVERMGGSVGVESTPGTGSTFWIALERP